MNDNTFIDFFCGSFIGLSAWFFGGLDALLKVLIAFAVVDYLTGLAVAWVNSTINSKISARGVVKKCLMLSLIGVAHLLDSILPGDTGAIRMVVCTFYIATEGISIIENADKLGIPIPKALTSRLLSHMNDNNNND